MITEYIIWGVPPKQTHEVPLYTLAKSRPEAQRVIEKLKNDHGCRDMRIHELDPSVPPEFGKNVLNI